MKTVVMNVNDLKSPERNVRVHPQKQLKELNRSVDMFGQIRPVVIDEEGMILAGNGLVEAYRQAGREEIQALVMEGLTEADKIKLMIADNKTFSLGMDDNQAALELIKEMGDYNIPGYDDEVLQRLLSTDFSNLVDRQSAHEYGIISEEDKGAYEKQAENKENRIQKALENRENEARKIEEEREEGIQTIMCPNCSYHIKVKM